MSGCRRSCLCVLVWAARLCWSECNAPCRRRSLRARGGGTLFARLLSICTGRPLVNRRSTGGPPGGTTPNYLSMERRWQRRRRRCSYRDSRQHQNAYRIVTDTQRPLHTKPDHCPSSATPPPRSTLASADRHESHGGGGGGQARARQSPGQRPTRPPPSSAGCRAVTLETPDTLRTSCCHTECREANKAVTGAAPFERCSAGRVFVALLTGGAGCWWMPGAVRRPLPSTGGGCSREPLETRGSGGRQRLDLRRRTREEY